MSSLIVQLGAPNAPDGRLSAIAQSRCELSWHCWQQDCRQTLVCTGGFGEHFNQSPRPHGEWVKAALMAKGIPADQFLPCILSRFTFEDASLCVNALQTLSIDTLTIVTSDFHLPRVRLIFDALLLHRPPPLFHASQLVYMAAPTPLPPADISQLIAHEQAVMAREQQNISDYRMAKKWAPQQQA
ncbi:YdcF family protein [Shewanella sp. NIFS-20-20]|uniref:YdcF family protein n=1 Tax=Shewanella sp. NIFS-20-20 TaxID=2853806 RepID=UPI001C486D35|nr:YdcF family protein [Shewanella sp. NIFS-20-20]MBV7314466.1 YdcF family protein [Shewanella sp. NIFS-20-20]